MTIAAPVRKKVKKGSVGKFQGGRVCKKMGCRQKLSVYNAKEYCYTHQSEFLK